MAKGIIAFLVLASFVPGALYALEIHRAEANGIASARQLMLEQQAITNKALDFEETFWRAAEKGGVKQWEKEMSHRGISVWYGGTGGPEYARVLDNPPRGSPASAVLSLPGFVTVTGGEHEQVVVFAP